MDQPIRVTQLSDTHFLEAGAEPEGMGAYDTSVAFDRVFADIVSGDQLTDYVVVTGDVADHGRAEQYEVAAEALGRFDVDVRVCPGNHDFDMPFHDGFSQGNIEVPRVVEMGSWAFLFADSSSGMMVPGDDGRLIDPPGETRLHSNGSFSTAETAWLRDACSATDAEHVFVWLHHPPGVTNHFQSDPDFTDLWRELLGDLPTIRGLGAGHLHMPLQWDLVDRPVFLAPSLKNNFSLADDTWLPPGYRTYEFGADGSVSSQAHFVDDEELWPRRPLGRALRSLFAGELSFEELAEIIARRQITAATQST